MADFDCKLRVNFADLDAPKAKDTITALNDGLYRLKIGLAGKDDTDTEVFNANLQPIPGYEPVSPPRTDVEEGQVPASFMEITFKSPTIPNSSYWVGHYLDLDTKTRGEAAKIVPALSWVKPGGVYSVSAAGVVSVLEPNDDGTKWVSADFIGIKNAKSIIPVLYRGDPVDPKTPTTPPTAPTGLPYKNSFKVFVPGSGRLGIKPAREIQVWFETDNPENDDEVVTQDQTSRGVARFTTAKPQAILDFNNAGDFKFTPTKTTAP